MKNKQNQGTIHAFIDGLFDGFDERYEQVIRARYGLHGKAPQTLQSIGDKFKITRERVRQIEASILGSLVKKRSEAYIRILSKKAREQLKTAGGLEREDRFFSNVHRSLQEKSELVSFEHPATFLLELSGDVFRHRDTLGDWHPFWYISSADRKQANAFIAKLVSALKSNRADAIRGAQFERIMHSVAAKAGIPAGAARNYLDASKRFVRGPFGAFGPSDWAEINPKTARDWAYLILEREGKPLHFSDISKLISQHRKTKKTNMQTIHNELIKDDRFVLVGRGLYGLKKAGFVPGTAREVIGHVLKKSGPLKRRDVVKKVLEQRMLKEGTILINLQNRKHFQCLPDGRYCLRQA